MTATDVVQRLREAIVAIVNGLATVQTLTGRATQNCVEWNGVAEGPRPVIAYLLVGDLAQQGESGDGRDGTIQFTAIAEGNDADSKVQYLLEAVEKGFTAPALLAQGVDGAPLLFARRLGDNESGDSPESPRDLARNTHVAHLDVEFTLTHS